MLSAHFGAVIKKERLARGQRQEELAASARVSRSILSHLEQGKARPVQTDVLDRVFLALNVNPLAAATASDMDARRQARLDQARLIEERRERHLRLAVRLATEPDFAKHHIILARERVALWKREKTCSPYYIRRWSQLLALPAARLASRMCGLCEWEEAMFQNSPWSAVWS